MEYEPTAAEMLAWGKLVLWSGWEHVEFVELRDAGCLLTNIDPRKNSRNRVIPSGAQTMIDALMQAIIVGSLRPFALYGIFGDEYEGYRESPILSKDELTPHTRLSDATTVKVADLAAWCDARAIAHPWQQEPQRKALATLAYPDELRAAIEAFEAVHANPAATAKQTPKAALAAWLEQNKPELSANARERIATVANWQPQGGVPKTPGS